LNGEVTFVPMGHYTGTANTTDMLSQTEIKRRLPDIAKNNRHLNEFFESGKHLKEDCK